MRNFAQASIKRHNASLRSLQVAALLLLVFEGLEQRLEVAHAEALAAVAFDHFDEGGGTILNWFAEYLQQIALVIEIDQDAKFLDLLEVFLDVDVLQAFR